MSRTWRILIVGLVLALAITLLCIGGHRSQSRKRLSQYKASLRAKGEKLTFKELTASQTDDPHPFAALLTNAIAYIGQQPLSPGILELRKYASPGRAFVGWKQDRPPWRGLVPAGRSGWEDFALELDALQPQLEQILKAAGDPPAGSGPVTNLFVGPVIHFVTLRSASYWLMGAAINELHEGRREEALKYVAAIAAMARVNREDCFLVSQMIRVAIAGRGIAATWEALAADGWTDAQLERLQKAWEAVPLIDGLEKGLLGERAVGADVWSMLHNPAQSRSSRNLIGGSPKKGYEAFVSDHVFFPLYKMASIDDDELFHLTTMQEAVEAVRLLKDRRPRTEAKQRLDQFAAKVSTAFGSPSQRLRYWFSAMCIPNCSRAVETTLRNETERQLTIAAIAIKRYQLRHGQLPAELPALTPELLTALPYDPMSGKELRYRRNADGGFVLYSVGEDGRDDGGSVTPLAATNQFRLWETRDAVWPAAVN